MPSIPIDQLVIGNRYTLKSTPFPVRYYRNRLLTKMSPQTDINPECPCPVFGTLYAVPHMYEFFNNDDPEIPPDEDVPFVYKGPAAEATGGRKYKRRKSRRAQKAKKTIKSKSRRR
jgi:hypothetical protein